MQQRKIIDLSIENDQLSKQSQRGRHIIMIKYDDASQKKIELYGDELPRILNKNFKKITLSGSFSGNFTLEAVVRGYFGGYYTQRETLTVKDVIALFNERGYLVDIHNKKNLLDLHKDHKNNHVSISQSQSSTKIINDAPKEKKADKQIIKSYNPHIYYLRSISDKNKKPWNNVIEIDCHTDVNGPYIEYRLIGTDKKEVSGMIKQEDIPDSILPHHVDEIIKNDENREKWLNLILDVTTKRGHTNTTHTPPPVDLGPFPPYIQPKGWLRYDEDRGMYFYDNSLSQHLKQAGLFATKTAAVALVGYAIYQGLKP